MYTIKNASIITGIGVHTLRAWEKRYSVVTPSRSSSGRRFYCREDIEKLRLITTLNKTGEQISSIAKLSDEELRERVGQLSESQLYPEEDEKIYGSLFILKKAFEAKAKDVIFHEFESMGHELEHGTYRLKSYISKLIIPYYEYVIEQFEQNCGTRALGATVFDLLAANLRESFSQLAKDPNKALSIETDALVRKGARSSIFSEGFDTTKREIDSLISCAKTCLNGKEVLSFGPIVNIDMAREIIEKLPSTEIVVA